jgi:hypothetical protein
MKKATIYGERCSGTKYLQKLLEKNFNVELTWEYGWKHFFGHSDLTNSNDVLFIGIVRNLADWINSFYLTPHHVPRELSTNVESFLNNEWYSIDDSNNEILQDRHIETGNRYKNILEMRHVKNKYLVETMPTVVKHYCLITYDDLINDFVNVMNKIKNSGLESKEGFPINISNKIEHYGVDGKYPFEVIKRNDITMKMILKGTFLHYENILFKLTKNGFKGFNGFKNKIEIDFNSIGIYPTLNMSSNKVQMSGNSFVISRAFSNITAEFVEEVLKAAELGTIKQIDRVEAGEFAKFYIHMDTWTAYGEEFRAALLARKTRQDAGELNVQGIKITYDEHRPRPYYWLVYAAETLEEREERRAKEEAERLKHPKVRIVL